MPIYEYKCRDCGNIGKFLVGFSGDTPAAEEQKDTIRRPVQAMAYVEDSAS